MALVCLFLFESVATADSFQQSSSTLSPESRLKPFSEKHGLDFKNTAIMACVARELRDLIKANNLRDSHIVRFNQRFPDGSVTLDSRIMTGIFQCTKRAYRYAVFHFKGQKTIHALFVDELTDAERAELKIKDNEKHLLNHPGLEGVWFVNPAAPGTAKISGLETVKREMHPDMILTLDMEDMNKDLHDWLNEGDNGLIDTESKEFGKIRMHLSSDFNITGKINVAIDKNWVRQRLGVENATGIPFIGWIFIDRHKFSGTGEEFMAIHVVQERSSRWLDKFSKAESKCFRRWQRKTVNKVIQWAVSRNLAVYRVGIDALRSAHPAFASDADFRKNKKRIYDSYVRPFDPAEWQEEKLVLMNSRLFTYSHEPLTWYRYCGPLAAPSSDVSLSGYMEDIETAETAGRITVSPTSERDIHSHLNMNGALDTSNTRALVPTAERIFRKILNMRGTGKARILELGPGVGRACYDMRGIAKGMNKDIELSTVNLTPVAPSFGLRMTSKDIRRSLLHYVGKTDIKDLGWLPNDMKSANAPDSFGPYNVPLWIALELQRQGGYKIFDILNRPLIDRQYIGRLLDDSIMPDGEYEFIYDDFGSLYYSSLDGSYEAFGKTLHLLSPDGIFYMDVAHVYDYTRMPKGFIAISSENTNMIVVREGSKWRRSIDPIIDKLSMTSAGVYYIDTLDPIIDAIEQCAIRETAPGDVSAHSKLIDGKRILTGYREYLNEKGLALMQQVDECLADFGDQKAGQLIAQIPSVENPHTELFIEINLPDKILEYRGNVMIETHEGCYNQCSFCQASILKKYRYMPYPMLAKLAKALKKNYTLSAVVLYDASDPIHYRDSVIDADFADVYHVFAECGFNEIQITTNGWDPKDKIAQRAAEKLVPMLRKRVRGPSSFNNNRARLSYHFYYDDLIDAIVQKDDKKIIKIRARLKEKYLNIINTFVFGNKLELLAVMNGHIDPPIKKTPGFPEALLKCEALQDEVAKEIDAELKSGNISTYAIYHPEEDYKTGIQWHFGAGRRTLARLGFDLTRLPETDHTYCSDRFRSEYSIGYINHLFKHNGSLELTAELPFKLGSYMKGPTDEGFLLLLVHIRNSWRYKSFAENERRSRVAIDGTSTMVSDGMWVFIDDIMPKKYPGICRSILNLDFDEMKLSELQAIYDGMKDIEVPYARLYLWSGYKPRIKRFVSNGAECISISMHKDKGPDDSSDHSLDKEYFPSLNPPLTDFEESKKTLPALTTRFFEKNAAPEPPDQEAANVHAENLRLTPAIPDKTILCHVITDSILPDGQKTMLKTLEQDMRDAKYGEKVVSLQLKDMGNPEDFMKELAAIKDREEKSYSGYKVEFDVACPEQGLVAKVQGAGMRALAFTKAGDGDIVQVEGIILALRALRAGDIQNLLDIYKLLTGEQLSTGTADINELARTVLFVLPARKADINIIGKINNIIEKNIKAAA